MLISTQNTLTTELANKRDPGVRLATVWCVCGTEQNRTAKAPEDQSDTEATVARVG